MTEDRTLGAIAHRTRQINAGNGFTTPRTLDEPEAVLAKLALIHAEVSEAVEEARKKNYDARAFREELADIVIRTMDLAEGLGMDLETAVHTKLEYNTTRPYKHSKRI